MGSLCGCNRDFYHDSIKVLSYEPASVYEQSSPLFLKKGLCKLGCLGQTGDVNCELSSEASTFSASG